MSLHFHYFYPWQFLNHFEWLLLQIKMFWQLLGQVCYCFWNHLLLGNPKSASQVSLEISFNQILQSVFCRWRFRFFTFCMPDSMVLAIEAASRSLRNGVRISNKTFLYGVPNVSSECWRWHIKKPSSFSNRMAMFQEFVGQLTNSWEIWHYIQIWSRRRNYRIIQMKPLPTQRCC